MTLTRRSLFRWLAGVAAGTVLAKMPLAGFTPSLNHPHAPLRQFTEFEMLVKQYMEDAVNQINSEMADAFWGPIPENWSVNRKVGLSHGTA